MPPHESDPAGWKFVYEEVNGRGHAFPEKGPKPGLEWMASHERDPRPVKIRWQPTREWKKRFYWIRWEEPWLRSELVAVLDRDANRIDITVERPRSAAPQRKEEEREGHVRSIKVSLDDRLVDMTKEVVVTIDGVERFRGVPELSLATLIRTAEEREDPEYVFAFEAEMGPPPAESGSDE